MSQLHPGQQRILGAATRFNSVACGRRFGKTTLGLALAFHGAPHAPGGLAQGFDVGWFSPSYKLLDEAWRAAKSALKGVIVRSDIQQRRIEVTTQAALDFWTLETEDCGRGRRYGLIVVDEAAMARNLEIAWNASIRPTLSDAKGGAWFFSTPKGRNFFWQLHQRGENRGQWPEWTSHHAPTSSNPVIDPVEIEAARKSLPERIFAQEYLAQFLDDGGGVFRGVMEAVDESVEVSTSDSSAITIGIDWGRHHDFTVLVVLDHSDKSTPTVVAVDRFTGIDYGIQLDRLRALYRRFPRAQIVAESNSLGEPLIESLQREGLPVRSFQTTANSKRTIIEALALAFERRRLRLPAVPWLIDELMAYEQERLPGGLLRYNAPPGGHDDGVMALAIALYSADNNVDMAGIQMAGDFRLGASFGERPTLATSSVGWGAVEGTHIVRGW